jgi:beta-lactamase regulating signal transducer with metallopeptidase domain
VTGAAADAAKTAVIALAMMAAQGTALALIAFTVQKAFGKRLPPAWLAAAWLVVFVKLVLPWGPAMPWSLADLFATAAPVSDDPVAQVLPFAAAAPVAHASLAWLGLAAAWLAVSTALLARAVIAYRRAYAAARRAPLASQTLIQRVAAQLGVRAPRLAVGDPAVGPHVIGALRPIVVVPPALLGDATLLRAALLHELAHVRRRDALGRGVQLLAGAVFFWWPVVRLASRRLDLAREAACDAWALEAGELARPAYARLLVHMAQLRGAGLAMSAAHLNARVAAVLGPPVRARLSAPHKLAIAAWTAVALGGARTASAHGDHPACLFTPQLAAQLYVSHPEADLDGDGALSRDEACELQASLRARLDGRGLYPTGSAAEGRRGSEDAGTVMVTVADPLAALEAERLVAEPLCCNCDEAEGQPLAATLSAPTDL